MNPLALLHFRQCLSSNLHFRQFNGSKTRNVEKVGGEISRFRLNLRQIIGSSGGKELGQVTVIDMSLEPLICRRGNLMVPIAPGNLLVPKPRGN
jgi:hypothetical protein